MKDENIIFKGQFLSQFDYECELQIYIDGHINSEPLNLFNELWNKKF